jgi:hypothetical protein
MSRFIGTCVPSATHYLFFCGGNCKFPVFLSAKLQIRQNGRRKIETYFEDKGFSKDLKTVFGVEINDQNDLYKVLSDKEQFGKIFKLNLDE